MDTRTLTPGAAPVVERAAGGWRARWHALGGPCELLADGGEALAFEGWAGIAAAESRRIEQRFSRYRDDSVIAMIQRAHGAPVELDDETASLIDYAAECHALSDGRFDITSGVLRKLWRFDGSDRVPARDAVHALLSCVGWDRVRWQRPVIQVPEGMELDLGGLGKEYAVDRAAAAVAAVASVPFVVNFGGDLFAPGPRADGAPWSVAIDDPEQTGRPLGHRVALERGGLATSGDARRFVWHAGRRLGHILDPRTGWPVEDAPCSVTVLATTCLEAGTLATFAVLAGAAAETLLTDAGVRYHIERGPGVAR